MNKALRGIMKYTAKTSYEPPRPKFIDIQDGQEKFQRLPTKLKFADMPGYRKEVQAALLKVCDQHPTLHKAYRKQSLKSS